MFKSAFFICLTIMLYFTSFSQKTVFSYVPVSTGNRAAKSYPYESYIVPDTKTGKITVVIKNKDETEYLLLNKDFSIEEKLHPANGLDATIFKKKGYQYRSGAVNNLGTCFYYFVKDPSLKNSVYEVYMEIADFKSKTVTNKMIFTIPPDEVIINSFSSEGVFNLLTARDKSGEIIFHTVDLNGKLPDKSILIDRNGLIKDKRPVAEHFSESNLYSPGQEITIADAINKTKIYVTPTELLIATANFNEPQLWRINTTNYTLTSEKEYSMDGFAGMGKGEISNSSSCLFGENLYLLNSTKEKIEIGIFNIASGKLLKKYEITESSNNSFLEPPVEILTKGRARSKKMLDNKKLIKELFRLVQVGIGVELNNQGQIILNCGEYDDGSAGFSMPGARGDDHVFTYNYTRSVNFKLLLDTTGLEVITGKNNISIHNKIDAFVDTIDDKSQAENIFTIGNKYFVCYYSPKNKTFFIHQIER